MILPVLHTLKVMKGVKPHTFIGSVLLYTY